jgi:hypothetical protein
MSTTTSPEDDHRKRIENLKAGAPAVAQATAIPRALPLPVIDPRLMVEKTLDLYRETRSILDENRRMLTENRASMVSLQSTLPGTVTEGVRQIIQPVISSSAGQRRDIDIVRQQSEEIGAGQADMVGTVKALCWILGMLAVAVLAVLGRSLL